MFALALALAGGHATLAVGLLTTLSTFATALLLWRLAARIDATGSDRAGRYAALFFVLLSPENEGYLGDSEVLLAPFAAGAFVLACEEGAATPRLAALAGLLAGCALQMKLSALPIVVVPALAIARRSRAPLSSIAAYGAAALVPFALEAALYARAGAFAAFADANVGATLRRATGLQRGIVRENLVWFRAQLRVLAPALELAPLALFKRANPLCFASWGWLAAALVSIAAVGEFYDRQFVLVEAPVALLGGIGLRVALDALQAQKSLRRFALVVAFLVTFALHDYWETAQAARIAYHRTVLREPGYGAGPYAELTALLRTLPHRSLFVMQLSPLLYRDLEVASPTRFPYTDHLLDPRMSAMTGVSGAAELRRIFDSRPELVVTGGVREPRFSPATVELVERSLARDYRSLRTTAAGATIYVRRAGAGTGAPSNRPK